MNIHDIFDPIREALTQDGDDHFEMTDGEVRATRSERSRTTLVYMAPADFLRMLKVEHVPWKVANTTDLLQRGVKYSSVPMLAFEHDGRGNAKVIGHEGRHRAMALLNRGVKAMPVILRSDASEAGGRAIRWGRAQDAEGFDHVPVMPVRLRGEDGRATIPMPHSVVFPAG